MNDISDWLEALGMPEYLEQFIENDVDVLVLAHLTDQDLKELGVTLGHRRKMLSAIQRREPSTSARTSPTLSPSAAPAVSPTIRAAAERRQLTVMFCDLVGSTALSRRVDPEDMREIIGAYHRCCTSLVQRHGGFVAKYMGDGLLAYFGYPQAHEHDAERAVQAGLAIVEQVPKLETPAGAPLHVRVGIATGVVVVGELIGSGEAQERGIVGDTPNLAARLQVVAAADSVVLADETRRLLGNLFELSDLGTFNLKGIANPTRAWAAIRPNVTMSRFEALNVTGVTPLVGREEECDLLLRRWAKAKAGEGQVILLTGEAGIGKSRLTVALLERLAEEPHTRLRYFCSPQHTDSAFYPIIGHLERAAGLSLDDLPETKIDKLAALLARSSGAVEDTSVIADLMLLGVDGRYPPSGLAPQQKRQRTMEILLEQIETLARDSSVLMIFEDAHWADPTSLELLGRLVERIEHLRVLLFVTFRPEFASPWVGRPYVRLLTINRLTQSEVGALIDHITPGAMLLASVRANIVERADGVPLFVEEMTKAVLEARVEGGAESTIANVPAHLSPVPASLHASLMARLDRLGEAKVVAQTGAAIGREFTHALLAAVAHETSGELETALDRLIHAGLLFRQGLPPHATYLFNHALVQDAAYGTLLREPRRALHTRIAEALESRFPEIAEGQPEILARHYTEAALIEKAARLWAKAGEQSLARSALTEAERQLTRALAITAALPGSPALRRERIRLQFSLANAFMHTKGYSKNETKEAFNQARELIQHAEALGEPPEDELLILQVYYGFFAANYLKFNGEAMRDISSQVMTLAQRQQDSTALMIGHRLVGMYLLHTGDAEGGRDQFDRVIALYNPLKHRALATRFGQDIGVAIFAYRSLALWILGYPDAARRDADRALADAHEIGHVPTLMYALTVTLVTLIRLGDFVAAEAEAKQLVALAEDKGAPFWGAIGKMQQLCIRALAGQLKGVAESIEGPRLAFQATGATAWSSYFFGIFAEALAASGNFDEAWHLIDEAQAADARSGEHWCDADILRSAGDIALLSPKHGEGQAQEFFERALEIAKSRYERSYELRAATSLARLFQRQGKSMQAFSLLNPVFAWFGEGFDTADLQIARALLDDLVKENAASK